MSLTKRYGASALTLLTLVAAPFRLSAANPIQTENALAGTTAWQLTNPATNREIEGYASLTSVNAGGQISFFVSTNDASYHLEMYRMGWYGGAGGRLVLSAVQRTGFLQPMPVADSTTGLIECNWTSPYTLTIPTIWVSGFHLVKLTGSSGKQSYIIFVVRNDAYASTYLFQSSVTTYQAYNNWGGKSLYSFNTYASPAVKVSFNRPYAIGPQAGAASGVGAADFLTNRAPSSETYAAGWEYNMV